VLFDDLEAFFIDCGCTSPLMYLHNSPGLLRVKQKRGQGPPVDKTGEARDPVPRS
jgi:hypothetical protein